MFTSFRTVGRYIIIEIIIFAQICNKQNMKACFMGLGYIGLPTAIIAARHGVEVVGVDINPKVVETINRGEIHIVEPGLKDLCKEVISSGHLKAALQPEESDVYLIVVPTPFKGDHEPDISYVEAATRTVVPFLKEGDLFIIESTSPVGTTEKMEKLIFTSRPELKDKLYIAYCPERVLPGNVIYELVHNDRVIGGIDEASTEKAKEFYRQFVKGTLHATNARTAEMCKLTENSSRDVQIAFANELSLICDKAGINVWKLIELANKHPRVNILQPGSGVGGHCIAVDPYFITADFPRESQIIGKAREINNYKAFWCAEKTQNAIKGFEIKNGREPIVALMGLAFKPNIDDLRESPAKYIATKVMQGHNDADFLIVEPNISEHKVFKLTDYKEAYEKADIVVFLVAHNPFKELPWRDDKVILDFCGIFKK
jgi:UDP-N-acetyl-D-mannosaminuronic acid dehydrogenase